MFRNQKSGTKEVAQWLRMPVALVEDLDLALSSHKLSQNYLQL